MRKIKSAADVTRVQRRNNIILGVVMIVLLTLSSVGYSLMSADGESENVVSELGFDFVRDGGLWKVNIGTEIFGFMYLPSELGDVDVDNISVELGIYFGQPLYFVNPGEGVGEILNNIGRYILRNQESCFLEDLGDLTSCEGNLPVKDCGSNLIVFYEGNDTRVYAEENCVFISGDVLMGSDAFLYEVLGIR